MARDIVEEMNEYYRVRAPWHDEYLSYTDCDAMEEVLSPVIAFVEPFVDGRDVLEIACGTGNWTHVLARRARSVVATDINESMLKIARGKGHDVANVTFRVADAYILGGVRDGFDAAFAADWWSHVPNSRIRAFLRTLHTRLLPDSPVVFVDMMYRDHPDLRPRRIDEEGNLIARRRLPNGQEFDVLKNFPTEAEVLSPIEDLGRDPVYHEDRELLRWMVAYRTV